MNDFCLIYKLYILIFLGLSFLVHGQNNEEGTIYTKWPLCECIPSIKKDVHHDILTKETQEHREFHACFDDDNIETKFKLSIIKSGNERKLIFQNYPREKFEPFIYQYDDAANWHGFQSVDIGKKYSSQSSFEYAINCERSNDIHILMPFSHGCNQLPEGFKELDVDKSVVLDKIKKLIVNCKVTGKNLELDIHVPVQCANFNINLLSSPLLMHLQNEYFSDTTKRSIAIKKTTDRKVVVTFFIDDKHPEEVTGFSKSILVWSNNKSEYYELTTKDLAENNIKFTHKLLSENKSDEQCLNQQNLLLLSQPKLPLGKKISTDDTGLASKSKVKKNSRVTIAKVQPVKKASKTLSKDKPQTIPTVTPSATTEIDIISKFTEAQQDELQTHLADIEVKEALLNASILLETLNNVGIKLSLSLFSVLKSFSVVKDHNVCSNYFKNANAFFLAVNSQQIQNTSCLSSMLKLKKHIKAFANESQYNIKVVAGNRCLKQLTSMCSKKGFPNKDEEEAFPKWECWKISGEFSLPLLRSISSMCNGKGLPKKKEVEKFLVWECWKISGKFSLPLLRAFSSMYCSKGLPKKHEVEKYLAWECWKVNGEFSLPLLQTFSSMHNGKGLPKKHEVEQYLAWECWKINGEFSLPLLRTFSSMRNGKGLAKKHEVEECLAWECWKVNGKFSLPLLQTFSSLRSGKGLPKKHEVEECLAWECWKVNGEFNLDLLQVFSPIFHSKGLPREEEVDAFIHWLPINKRKSYLKIVCRIFASCGLPKLKTLNQYINTLDQHVTKISSVSDDTYSDSCDSDYDQAEVFYIKTVSLFCAAPKKWRCNIAQCIKFMNHHKGIRRGRAVELSALETLLTILVNHGGYGVNFWLQKFDEQPQNKLGLTKILSIPAPLNITKFALKQLSEPDCYEYIELCKNLKPAPDKEQWDKLQEPRTQLNEYFTFTLRKRMMLEILWSQTLENISKYSNNFTSILNTVPTISQLQLIHQVYTKEKMKNFLDACLSWQAAKGVAPEVTIQESLLEGLLLAKQPLNGFGSIPKLCFSTRVANENGLGVIINGIEMSGQKRLLLFIAAMLIELEQTEYKFLNKKLTILPPDDEAVVLPKPEFAIDGAGFVIKNWSLNQLTDFFNATEFTEQWYQKDREARELCTRRREENLTRMATNNKHTNQTVIKKITPRFTPSVIIGLINRNIQLRPAILESIEGYAQKGQIGTELCTALESVIQKDPDVVSEVVKRMVTATLKQIQEQRAMSVKVTALPPLISTFETAMEALFSFRVLNKEELEMLKPHRAKMTTIQLMILVSKINSNVDIKIQQEWFTACDLKKKNPLDLGCCDDDFDLPDFDQKDQEDQIQDWFEDFVQ